MQSIHMTSYRPLFAFLAALALHVPLARSQEAEPNNSCDTAQAAGNGAFPFTLTGSLDPTLQAPDIDYYLFTGTPGDLLEAAMLGAHDAQGTLASPWLLVLDSTCNLIFGDGSAFNATNRMAFSVPEDGIFIVAASADCDWDLAGSHSPGSYRIEVGVRQTISVAGQVVDAETGETVSASLTLAGPVGMQDCWGYDELAFADSDGDAGFLFDQDQNLGTPLVAGSYQVRSIDAVYQGHTPYFDVAPGQQLDLGGIALQPRHFIGSLSGRLVDAATGGPLGNTLPRPPLVCIPGKACATPNADGRFSFDGLARHIEAGALTVSISLYGYEHFFTDLTMARYEVRDLGNLQQIPVSGEPPVAVGPELKLNATTGAGLGFLGPRAASGRSGDSLVVWPASAGIVGRRVDKKGHAIGPDFVIASGFTPSVCASASGDFVVVWGSSQGLFGRRIDKQGNMIGSEFQVSANGDFPDIGCDAQGGFVAAWSSFGDVWGQRFDRNARQLGSVFQLSSDSTSYQSSPKIAVGPSGNFVAAWTDFRLDAQGDVFARRFDQHGNPLGEDALVNTYTQVQQGFYIGGKGISIDSEGNFVVVWNSWPNQDASSDGVFGQRFDWQGHKLGREFQANTQVRGGQWPVAVAGDQEGNFLVTWHSNAGFAGTDGNAIYGQLYGSDGRQIGTEFQVNTITAGVQDWPAVSAGGEGKFVVAWYSAGASVAAQTLHMADAGDD